MKLNGISKYSIFLDESTNGLFGILKISDTALLANFPTSRNAKMVVAHERYHGM